MRRFVETQSDSFIYQLESILKQLTNARIAPSRSSLLRGDGAGKLIANLQIDTGPLNEDLEHLQVLPGDNSNSYSAIGRQSESETLLKAQKGLGVTQSQGWDSNSSKVKGVSKGVLRDFSEGPVMPCLQQIFEVAGDAQHAGFENDDAFVRSISLGRFKSEVSDAQARV